MRLKKSWINILVGLSFFLAIANCGSSGGSGGSGGSDAAPDPAPDPDPVVDKKIVSVYVTPGSIDEANRTAVDSKNYSDFQLKAKYNDGSPDDVLNEDINWSLVDTEGKALISQGGQLRPYDSTGDFTLTAQYSDKSAQVYLRGEVKTIVSIGLNISDVNIIEGQTSQLQAVATYDDGSTADITNNVSWTIDPSAKAKISSDGLVYDTNPGDVNIDIDNYQGKDPSAVSLFINEKQIIAISIIPDTPVIAINFSVKLTATAQYDNGTDKDVSGIAVWTNEDGTFVDVSSDLPSLRGTATGKSAGSETISASIGDVSGDTDVIVADAELKSMSIEKQIFRASSPFFPVDLNNPVPLGIGAMLEIMGHFANGDDSFQFTQLITDDSNVNWNSDNESLVSIPCESDCKIQVNGDSDTAEVTASYENGDVSDDTVTITATERKIIDFYLSPSILVLNFDDQALLSAILSYTNGADTSSDPADFTWQSSNENVASVINGQVTAGSKTAGYATITATLLNTYLGELQRTAVVQVSSPIITLGQGYTNKTVSGDYTINLSFTPPVEGDATADYMFSFIPVEETEVRLTVQGNDETHDCELNVEYPRVTINLEDGETCNISLKQTADFMDKSVDFSVSVIQISDGDGVYNCPSCTPCIEGCINYLINIVNWYSAGEEEDAALECLSPDSPDLCGNNQECWTEPTL